MLCSCYVTVYQSFLTVKVWNTVLCDLLTNNWDSVHLTSIFQSKVIGMLHISISTTENVCHLTISLFEMRSCEMWNGRRIRVFVKLCFNSMWGPNHSPPLMFHDCYILYNSKPSLADELWLLSSSFLFQKSDKMWDFDVIIDDITKTCLSISFKSHFESYVVGKGLTWGVKYWKMFVAMTIIFPVIVN